MIGSDGDLPAARRKTGKMSTYEINGSVSAHLIQIDAKSMLHRRASQEDEDDKTLDAIYELEKLQSQSKNELDQMFELEDLGRSPYKAKFKKLVNGGAPTSEDAFELRDGQIVRVPVTKRLNSPKSARSRRDRQTTASGQAGFLDSFALAKPQSARGPWDAADWLRAREQLIQDGRAKDLCNLVRMARASTEEALKKKYYTVNVMSKKSTVDLSKWLVPAEGVRWLGQRNITVPRMPAVTPGKSCVEPPMIAADMSALDIVARINTTSHIGKRDIYTVVEVRQFDADGTFTDMRNATPSLQNLLIRTDLSRFLHAAQVEVRAGRSTVKDHMCATTDPYMFLCPKVTVFRGLREDGYPFYQKPMYISVLVCAMSCIRPGLTTSTNVTTSEQTLWYRADDDQTALLERLSLIGCAALQKSFKPDARPVLILEPLGCTDRGLHPRDAVASSLKHWRQRFGRLFHTVFLACGNDKDLAYMMDIAINARVYASLITKDVSDFADWHWDRSLISMHVGYKDIGSIADMYLDLARQRRGSGPEYQELSPRRDRAQSKGATTQEESEVQEGENAMEDEQENGDPDFEDETPSRRVLTEGKMFNLLGGALADNATHGHSLDDQEDPAYCICGKQVLGDAKTCQHCDAHIQQRHRRGSLESQAKGLYKESLTGGALVTMSGINEAHGFALSALHGGSGSASPASPSSPRLSLLGLNPGGSHRGGKQSTFLDNMSRGGPVPPHRVNGGTRTTVAEVVVDAARASLKGEQVHVEHEAAPSPAPSCDKRQSRISSVNLFSQPGSRPGSRMSVADVKMARKSVADAMVMMQHNGRSARQRHSVMGVGSKSGGGGSGTEKQLTDEQRAWEIRQSVRRRLQEKTPADKGVVIETLHEEDEPDEDDEQGDEEESKKPEEGKEAMCNTNATLTSDSLLKPTLEDCESTSQDATPTSPTKRKPKLAPEVIETEWQVRRDAHALVSQFRNAADDFWSKDSASRRQVAQLRRQHTNWSPHAHGEYRKRAQKKKSQAGDQEPEEIISEMARQMYNERSSLATIDPVELNSCEADVEISEIPRSKAKSLPFLVAPDSAEKGEENEEASSCVSPSCAPVRKKQKRKTMEARVGAHSAVLDKEEVTNAVRGRALFDSPVYSPRGRSQEPGSPRSDKGAKCSLKDSFMDKARFSQTSPKGNKQSIKILNLSKVDDIAVANMGPNS
eukprot:TRINITY_DN1388_c0_g1_i3.p1 TRINITY_DN1388_c0_g1~~TRINITY_DN1388_c0_g1_i3.p1  ORF type:complete len:1199 (-),score=159.82 TRINITY_DN1388_c0_g1_i3:285-3881(-)